MSIQKNFEYLGQSFQLQLLNQIIVDKDFAHSIIDVIEPSHFENKYFKTILQMVKEYYKKYQCSPSFDTLEQISKSEFPQEMMLRILMDTIKQIQNANSIRVSLTLHFHSHTPCPIFVKLKVLDLLLKTSCFTLYLS